MMHGLTQKESVLC